MIRKFMLVTATVVVVGAIAVVMTRKPVLLSLTEPGELQRPTYTIFNPLRDRQPENAAEHLLSSVRRGDIASTLATVRGYPIRPDVHEKERLYPLVAWKLVDREDTPAEVKLVYRTARGDSGQFDSRITIRLHERRGRWVITGFSPIY
jgi:hypothetical protein